MRVGVLGKIGYHVQLVKTVMYAKSFSSLKSATPDRQYELFAIFGVN
jgi:hypothetical protein